MKKILIKTTALMLSIIMFVSLSNGIFAIGDAAIAVSSVTAKAGDEVSVTLSLENNPGIVSMTLRLNWDSSVLTLTKVTDGGIIGATAHKPELQTPYTLVWVNDMATTNFTENGVIVTLTFEVAESAEAGEYPITVSYDYDNYDIYDKDVELVKFEIKDGAVTVEEENASSLGDLNSDGLVNMKDIIILKKIVAGFLSPTDVQLINGDLNGDGYLNMRDIKLLRKKVAGVI